MSKTYEQIIQELDAPIPRSAVSTREGGGRSSLSYLEGWYVIDRLNKVLGQGNWGYYTELTKVYEGEVNGKFTCHYLAQVTLRVNLINDPNGPREVSFEEVGYGDGTDKYNPGKAHELAAKEAITDGLKRAAKNLGMSMGLALYDKSQEFVDDAAPSTTQAKPAVQPVPSAPAPAVAKQDKPAKPAAKTPPPTKQLIKTAFTVLEAKKAITRENFVKQFLQGAKVDELSDAGAAAVLDQMKSTFPEIMSNL